MMSTASDTVALVRAAIACLAVGLAACAGGQEETSLPTDDDGDAPSVTPSELPPVPGSEAEAGGASLPSGALLRLGSKSFRHPDGTSAVAISSDGARVAVGEQGGRVVVWDVESGAQILDVEGHASTVTRVAFAMGGARVVSESFEFGGDYFAGDGAVRAWEVAPGGNKVLELEMGLRRDWAVAAGGSTLAFFREGALELLDLRTGKAVRAVRSLPRNLLAIEVSPDGEQVAIVTADSMPRRGRRPPGAERAPEPKTGIVLVAAASGKRRHVKLESARGLRFGPRGRLVAWSESRVVVVDPATGRVEREVSDLVGLSDVALASTGDVRLVERGPADDVLRLRETGDGGVFAEIAVEGRLRVARLSPEGGTLAVGAWEQNAEQSIQLWDAGTGKLRATIGHGARFVGFSRDGKRLVSLAPFERSAHIWDGTTGGSLVPAGHDQAVCGLAVSPDGRIVATSAPSTDVRDRLRLWDVASGRHLRSAGGIDGSLYPMSFSADGSILVGYGGQWTDAVAIGVVEVATAETRTIRIPGIFLTQGIGLVASGELVVGGRGDAGLGLYDLAAGARSATPVPRQKVWSHGLAVSGDRRRVAALLSPIEVTARDEDGTPYGFGPGAPELLVWEVEAGRVVCTTGEVPRELADLGQSSGESCTRAIETRMSADGGRGIVSSPQGVEVYDVARCRRIAHVDAARGTYRAIALSADGEWLATGEDADIVLWNASSGAELRRIGAGEADVSALALGPGDGYLAAGLADGTSLFWDLRDASTGDGGIRSR